MLSTSREPNEIYKFLMNIFDQDTRTREIPRTRTRELSVKVEIANQPKIKIVGDWRYNTEWETVLIGLLSRQHTVVVIDKVVRYLGIICGKSCKTELSFAAAESVNTRDV